MASINKNDNDEAVNPYLAMREAKIARNEKRLSELGLLKPPPPPKQKAISKKPQQRNEPVRRSNRISSQEIQPDYKDGESYRKRTRDTDTEGASSYRTLSASTRKTRAYIPTKETSPKIAPAPSADSVRSISLDIEYLVLGHSKDHTDGLLGKMLERPGKDYVIHKSFAEAAYPEDRQRLAGGESKKLSFNKYSGVQEWKNCIFLWVNLGTEDSPNKFLHDGNQITWYGGSRLHESSPMFHKLKESEDSNIVLWVRRYNPETKSLSPYVCFGRLQYRQHEYGSHPLKFVWELDDYYDLLVHDDYARVETFHKFKEGLTIDCLDW